MATFNLVETIYGSDKKPRSTHQWEEISRANTQRVTQMGCNVPLAWVVVHGKTIPPNAIIAGEDKRRPLYIARTFWEGGVHIGQAGQHLEKGASFAYNGGEIHVDTYEVLVPLQHTIRYEISESYTIPTIPRVSINPPPIKPVVDVTVLQLTQKLRSVKIVMVIDDSISMAGSLWSQARSALMGLVSIIESDINVNGIDLCFMNHPIFETEIRDRHRIESIFDSVSPRGATPAGEKLQEVFNRYLPQVEDLTRNSPPIVVMVITDGVPTDDVESVIAEAARRQDRNHVPPRRLGVSFVQIGNDPDAAEFLAELDDDISARFGCRDMVDATPYNPNHPELTREAFLKCVLGSIDAYYDSIHNNEVTRPQSEKGHGQMGTGSIYSPLSPGQLSMPHPMSMPLAN